MSVIKINMDKAKKIWREKISTDRKRMFEENDLAIRDAQISGDEAALAKAVKRRDELRDIGQKIDEATTVDALKKIVPED